MYSVKKFCAVILLLLFVVVSAGCSGGGGTSVTTGAPTQTHVVTYSGNGSTGGSVPTDSNHYQQGQTVTVLGNTNGLVRSGYSFIGWNTLANGTGTGYTQGQTFMMGTANVTLYARWTTNTTYTVTYNGNGSTGGSVPTDSTNYQQGQTVTVLGNTNGLVRSGYSFIGWNTLANGTGTSYTQGQTFMMGTANVILYATWTTNPTYGVLPSYNDAYANWKNAGLLSVGGIPNRTTVCGATVNPVGGGQDDYTNIQNAINNCPAGQVVQLGAGAFSIHIADEAITIPAGITLRGFGTCNNASSPYCPTSITVTDGLLPYTTAGGMQACGSSSSPVACPNGGPPIIAMGLVQPGAGSVGWLSGVALDADATQGATTVQVHTMSAFSAGQYVLIDEDPAAGWVNDPVGAENYGQVWATSDWLSSSGGPATGRMVWPGANGSNGWDLGTTDPRTDGSMGCWFTNNCGRANAEIHKIASVGSGPCPGTSCTITFDDPLTVSFRQSGGHNAMVYPPGVTTCNGCAWQPGQNMLENAGVENLSLRRGPNGTIDMNFCAGCWVKNVEVADWYGGIKVMNSYRSEFNTILDQYNWWTCNNGAEYAIDLQAASTEILVTNSIFQYAGKSMTARAGGAGSVISYNVFDKTMYSNPPGCISDTWVETSIPSGHYPGAHHILMEGNWTENLDVDNTHGSNAYHTAVRNESTGARSKFTDPSTGTVVDDINNLPGGNGPLRAVGPMAYNYWMAYVGNVLGISGKTTAANGWVYDSTCGWCSSSIFMLGWTGDQGGTDPYLDGIKGSYLFRHGNYDYYNNAVLWDTNYSDHTLPDSFYLSAKPAFFAGSSCTYAWPWVTPTSSTQIQSNSCGGSGLPAKARVDAGTPFTQP